MAIRVLAIAGLAVMSTAACSSTETTGSSMASSVKARLSAVNMCKAAGGTYSGGMCTPGTSPVNAQQMCAAHGGTYIPGGDYCEFDSGVASRP